MSRHYNNIIILLSFLIAVVLCAGCATGRAPDVGTTSVTVRTDTVRDTVLIAKSNIIRQYIQRHDSTSTERRNDTVFIDRWHTQTITADTVFIDRLHTATTSKATVRDTLRIPVERKLTKWERTKQDVGGSAIGALALVVAVALFRFLRWLRTKTKIFPLS